MHCLKVDNQLLTEIKWMLATPPQPKVGVKPKKASKKASKGAK